MDNDEESQPEQCFYASFKIYLSDSRKNSVCGGSDDSDPLIGEVVRIEKTLEVSDADDEDKTLSLTTRDDDIFDKDDTDNEEEIECDPRARLLIANIDRTFKRSLSESDESPTTATNRRDSRSLQRCGRHEQTQSVERLLEAPEAGPVFYLDPLDWIRTEGSIPLPLKEKSPSKLLDNFNQERAKTNLDVFTESEENLNSEIEAINSNIALHNEQRPLAEQRNSSLPNFRLETPTIVREETPDHGYSDTPPCRSITPGEKMRRTTFPILCSRPGSACDKMVRRKSCVSTEDIRLIPRRLSECSQDDVRNGKKVCSFRILSKRFINHKSKEDGLFSSSLDTAICLDFDLIKIYTLRTNI